MIVPGQETGLVATEVQDIPVDDFPLMRSIAARDQAAFRLFYDRHSDLVYALCLRILRNRADAEELLVDVFWELWERAARYEEARGNPRTYLLTLARSRAIDRLRARRVATADIDHAEPAATTDSSDDPVKSAISAESRLAIRQAIDRLDPQQRQAIECAYYEGLSHSEIADKLNKPLGTVKTYIRQGLIHLRELVRNQYGSQ